MLPSRRSDRLCQAPGSRAARMLRHCLRQSSAKSRRSPPTARACPKKYDVASVSIAGTWWSSLLSTSFASTIAFSYCPEYIALRASFASFASSLPSWALHRSGKHKLFGDVFVFHEWIGIRPIRIGTLPRELGPLVADAELRHLFQRHGVALKRLFPRCRRRFLRSCFCTDRTPRPRAA